MSALVLLGDALHGAGFRLAGVQTLDPAPQALEAVFADALRSAALVMLSRACADALPPATLRAAQAGLSPLVVVLPDLRAPQADMALARRVQAALGIES